jgi:hypothetical protein
MMFGMIFQQEMVVHMAFQQAIITELPLSRSCLQGWFSTCHDYRYSLSLGCDFRVGLTAGNELRAGFILAMIAGLTL